jgi:hypothetical protein
MIDFYGGAGTFSSWPLRVRDYACQTTPANLLDRASAYDFELTPALLATVDIPTLVLWGEVSHPGVKRANELLGQCIPNAGVATVAGAAHFMISTHAKEVAGMIAQHVAHSGRSATELCQHRPGPFSGDQQFGGESDDGTRTCGSPSLEMAYSRRRRPATAK